MRVEFISAIREHHRLFGVDLSKEQVDRLAAYWELVMEHNALLHLVAPCSPEEFAVRHILECLKLLEHLPQDAKFVDVGSGAGLPAIPCLLVREDLKARLIESKERKARFLETAVTTLGLDGRAEIVNRQFAEASPVGVQFVTCRALDRFTEKLPALLRWAKRRPMLLFGGRNLREALQKQKANFLQQLMPLSEQRFLFVVKPQEISV
jgi:16S rRNA (guanine527-N7)-methyltransferase